MLRRRACARPLRLEDRLIRRNRRADGGAAAVEAALIICFLVLPLTFGIIGYGYMLSFRQAISQAASEAARAAAVEISATDGPAKEAMARTMINEAVASYGVSCGAVLNCEVDPAAECGTGTCAEVTVSYPYRDHSLLPSLPGMGIIYPKSLSYSASVRAD